MSERRAMKEGLDKPAVSRLALAFATASAEFDALGFQIAVFNQLEKLELRQRVNHIIDCLQLYLPSDFAQTAEILYRLPETFTADDTDSLGGFAAWPAIDYIAAHGLEHPDIALQLLPRLTHLFSAEFALRPFVLQHPQITLEHVQRWVSDDSPHVRRLASEGIRPRLPWGQQLPPFIADPQPVLQILEYLKDDESDYVRRSVANNLNDIAKDHPQRVIETCARWSESASPQRQWIIRHATRTLVKNGDPQALQMLGFEPDAAIRVSQFLLDREQLSVGEKLCFTFNIHSAAGQPQSLVIDYAVHHIKANGLRRAKVFKLRNLELATGGVLKLSKVHDFSPVTTRRYYEGRHAIELLVNGRSCGMREFQLYL